MNRKSLAVALVVLALCAAPTRAAFTTLLDALTAAVNAESAKLDGATDKASRKRKHSLDVIAENLTLDRSEGVADDVVILRANGATLLKLFGTSYAPVADALAALTQRVRDDAAALGAREPSIVDSKVLAKVDKTRVKALAILDAIDASKPFAQRAGKVLAAAEAVEAAGKQADSEAKCPKANPPGGHHGTMRATIGDRDFSSKYFNTSRVFKKGTSTIQRFVVSGTRDIGGQGDTVTIFIENAAFHGADTYVVDGVNVIVVYEFPTGVFYNLRQGDLVTLSLYDEAAHDVRGTFTGVFVGGGAPLTCDDGAFESCNWADSFTQ